MRAKTLARVGARKDWREASPTTCSLRVKNLMFYIIKFSHLKSNRLAGGTRPAHATPRSAPCPGSSYWFLPRVTSFPRLRVGASRSAPVQYGGVRVRPRAGAAGEWAADGRARGLGAPPGVRSLSVSPQVLACSWELPCAWRALHTSAVCAKVSAAGRPAGWGSGGGGGGRLPRDRPFAPRTGRRESVWPRGTSR